MRRRDLPGLTLAVFIIFLSGIFIIQSMMAEAGEKAPQRNSAKVLIVPFYFENDQEISRQISGWQWHGFSDGNPHSVKSWYDKQLGIKITGSVLAKPIKLPGFSGERCQDVGKWSKKLKTMVQNTKAGMNYDVYAFAFDGPHNCKFGGIYQFDSRTIVLPRPPSSRVLTHELGHYFGLSHSNSVSCSSVAGTFIPRSCVQSSYGDPYSVMGSVYGDHLIRFSAYEKMLLGKISENRNAEFSELNPKTYRIYDPTVFKQYDGLLSVEIPIRHFPANDVLNRQFKLASPSYYIEFANIQDFDTPLPAGRVSGPIVTIRAAEKIGIAKKLSYWKGRDSVLISSPGTGQCMPNRAFLLAGDVFADGLNHISVYVAALTDRYADVTVASGASAAKTCFTTQLY